jgi:hypothetical protein
MIHISIEEKKTDFTKFNGKGKTLFSEKLEE